MLLHECRGESLQLLAERAIYWPRERMLIAADVHFGKAATFRHGGIPIPRGTTQTNLERLTHLIQQVRPTTLLILGDLIHARAGFTAEIVEAVGAWRQRHRDLRWLVVHGNHDRRAGGFPDDWRIELHADGNRAEPFDFRHHPTADGTGYVVAGHVHPCIVLTDGLGGRLRAPCFWFGRDTAVLPAFGAFTGMHEIAPACDDAVYVVADGVHPARLVPPRRPRRRPG